MEKVEIIVTKEKVGTARLLSYPYRHPDYSKRKKYEVPLYKVIVREVKSSEEHVFKAVRFGVKRTKTRSAFMVGLQDKQEYILHWDYITSVKEMAWRVYDGFFIHRGPVNPLSGTFGSNGCIEICGLGEWDRFNTFIKKISECKNEEEVSKSNLAKVFYEKATIPRLKVIP